MMKPNPPDAPPPDNDNAAWPAPAYSWYVVSVLFVAYVFAFVDRQILSLMVEPIKDDLGLSDTEISLLHGLAFAFLYTIVGIPIGRLVDAGDRRRIVGVGIAFWSLMTAACGLARNFWTLFLCRVGVGVGEAALSPAAYSLISDYFPPNQRARALAVYTLGVSAGSGLAFIIGGVLYDRLAAMGDVAVPLFGVLKAWQMTFIVVGLPGLIVSVFMFTIREPVRRDRMLNEKGGLSLRDAVRFVWTRRSVYAPLFAGFGLLAMTSYAFIWMPALFARKFGWTPGEYGLYAGLIFISFGSAGILASGWIADALRNRGRNDGVVATLIAFGACSLLFSTTATLAPHPIGVLGLYALATFFMTAPFGLAPAAIQAVTPNEMRGQVSAVYLFVLNMLGLGLGPTVVALVTDYVLRSEAQLGLSISLTCVVLGPLGVLLLVRAYKPWCAEHQRLHEHTHTA